MGLAIGDNRLSHFTDYIIPYWPLEVEKFIHDGAFEGIALAREKKRPQPEPLLPHLIQATIPPDYARGAYAA